MARSPRIVHVTCDSAEGFRWLKRYLANTKGIASETPTGYAVLNESKWAEALRCAGGREHQ